MPCITWMGTGCLALHGAWYVISNSPPEQVVVSPQGAITMDTRFRTAVVEFYDADGDDINFEWFVAGRPERRVNSVFATERVADDGRLIQGSVLTVDQDEVEDGVVVECLVSDGDPDLPPRSIRWVIVEQES